MGQSVCALPIQSQPRCTSDPGSPRQSVAGCGSGPQPYCSGPSGGARFGRCDGTFGGTLQWRGSAGGALGHWGDPALRYQAPHRAPHRHRSTATAVTQGTAGCVKKADSLQRHEALQPLGCYGLVFHRYTLSRFVLASVKPSGETAMKSLAGSVLLCVQDATSQS